MIFKKLIFFTLIIIANFTLTVLGQTPDSPVATDAQADSSAQETPPFCCQQKHFVLAASEIAALQVLPWYFNRYVSADPWAILSLHSWHSNIQMGFEWDANKFSTNMFDHPFHGSTFFNAARSNGYDFWESSFFTYAGSFLWESFGEKTRPAINDWSMTSIGGLAIGESLHRVATMVRDNRATGFGRALRELGAFFIDPAGGFSRAVRGEMSRVGPNPENRFPTTLQTSGMLGYRSIGRGRLQDVGQATAFGNLIVQYGNPYEDYNKPFDWFNLYLQLNAQEKMMIGQFQIAGVLFGSKLYESKKVQHVFSIDLMFDYVNNQTYELGGHSFGFALRSRMNISRKMSIHTKFQPTAYIMTGIVSEYVDTLDRHYDFGSGLGFRFAGSINKSGATLLEVNYLGAISHTLNGAAGNQVVQFVRLRTQYPLWRSIGIGVEYLLYMRHSYFRDFSDIYRQNGEYRVFLSLF